MAIPLGARHYYGNVEFITPEAIRNSIKFEQALDRHPDVDIVIKDFKKYIDNHPESTFECNLNNYYCDLHPYESRIVCEPQYLRIVRPYGKKVHKQYIDSRNNSREKLGK